MANRRADEIQSQIDILINQKKAIEESEIALEDGGERAWADFLHSKQCQANHTDQCGWEYESWERPGYAREEFLKKARSVLAQAKYEGITPKMLLKVVRII